jgi:universal stress protein A
MSDYNKILVAVDLSEDSNIVTQRAKSFAARFDADLTLVHVVEYVPVEPMGEALLPAVQIEDELVESARKRLQSLAEANDLGDAQRWVEVGSIKSEVVRVAKEQNVDLIILGSHERHGVAIMLNFTEDTVLHAAPCDVLAIRLDKGH